MGGSVMRTIMRTLCILVVPVAVSLAPISGVAAEANEAKSLFEKRCSLCHSTSRALDKTKTAEEWKQTVSRMKGHAGDRISAADAETISKYLAEIRRK
jgi:cytochrome c5